MSGMNSRHSASSSGPPKNHRASALSAYASASMPPAYHSSPNQKTITSDGALSTAVSPLDDRPLDDRPRRMPPARCRVDRCDAREGRREAEGIEAAGRVRRLGCEPAKLITVALSGLSLSGARVDAFARAVDHKREPNRQRSLLALLPCGPDALCAPRRRRGCRTQIPPRRSRLRVAFGRRADEPTSRRVRGSEAERQTDERPCLEAGSPRIGVRNEL
mmetsp:Transcript_5572/g.17604  ORF Transcript_5572/g.17604 Transcript_5572/m.17604 type:complete len:218 (-) Transcript_5572:337-990(-)